MSLLRDIQNTVIEGSTEVSVVLRKCQVLAYRLGNEEFKSWIKSELDGYTSREELPQYRILKVQSYGHFSGIAGSGVRNAPIPPSCLPEEYREYVTTEYLMDPISYYESLIKGEHEGTFHSNWPADWIASFGKEIISGMNCMSAWKVIPAGVFVALVNTVKNRILSFVLEIEAEQPDAGEASPDVSPIPQERVSQVFNNIILGNVTTLTTSSQIISHTEINVVENNLESLDKFLNSIGLEWQDLEELHEAIDKDAQNDNKGDIGNKVSGWIDKMKAKAKSGAWNIAIATATHLLTKAILTYYGIVE